MISCTGVYRFSKLLEHPNAAAAPRFARLVFLAGVFLGISAQGGWSQIVTDGSVGAAPAGPLTGPAYTITADLGSTVGNNLFHSFSQFNVNSGESATFTGPSTIANVFTRVTGGTATNIDGVLRTSGMPNADFYLTNPAGVMFGPSASLDMPGAFVATTADAIDLADGGRFTATVNPADSVLTAAAPAAFGFLTTNPGTLSIQGSTINRPTGSSTTVISGDVSVDQASIAAPSGRVQIASVASPGTVTYDADQAVALDPGTFDSLGDVTVSQGSTINVSGDPPGAVVVRGGSLTIEAGAVVSADTTAAADPLAAAIDISVTGPMSVRQAQVGTITFGDGDAADIQITAESLRVSEASALFSQTNAAGAGGDVTVDAGTVEVLSGSQMGTFSVTGSGDAGDVRISADQIQVQGAFLISNVGGGGTGHAGNIEIVAQDVTVSSGSFLSSLTNPDGAGNAGTVAITTSTLDISDQGRIDSTTFGPGNAGQVVIESDDIVISHTGGSVAGIFTLALGGGNAGVINLNTGRLEMTGGGIRSIPSGAGEGGAIMIQSDDATLTAGAQILAPTDGSGSGGTIDLTVVNTLALSGEGTGITSETTGTGDAGNVTLDVGSLLMSDGALITTNAFGSQGGSAGDLTITAGQIVMTGRGADEFSTNLISSSSPQGGQSGNISITADRLELTQRSQIASNVFGPSDDEAMSPNGSITIDVEDLIVRDGSLIAVNTEGTGDAGDIVVDATRVVLSGVGQFVDLADPGQSGIASKAQDGATAETSAGSITITAQESVQIVDGASVGADTLGRGQGGTITINTPHLFVSGFDPALRQALANEPLTDGTQSSKASIRTRSTGTLIQDDATGNAGNIFVNTEFLELTNEGLIFSGTSTPGAGGEIFVSAQRVMIDSGASVSAASLLSGIAGPAGNIVIQDFDRFTLRGGGSVTTAAENANAGVITIGSELGSGDPIAHSIEISDGVISAAAGIDGADIKLTASHQVRVVRSTITGRAGNEGAKISIDPQFVILQDSVIDGRAGGTPVFVTIDPDAIFLTSNTQILTTTAALPPELDLAGSLGPGPVLLLGAGVELQPHCAVQFKANASSLTVWGRGGVPIDPRGFLPSVDLSPYTEPSNPHVDPPVLDR